MAVQTLSEPAAGNALIKDGAPIGYELTSGGAGYTTPPTVSVPGIKDVTAMVANGSISAIAIADKKSSSPSQK
ncbi:MAG TPA: hypothetical protein VG347_22425 [Verrucomicrobiae bacterium]|nr:hypothetical protein [Verrucomicrobiae bacterium]